MANRKATFAKRQRETDLKDRAKAKDARRAQKRNEVSENKGPQIAWDEAVRAVTSDELPSLGTANQRPEATPDDTAGPAGPPAAPHDASAAASSPGPAPNRGAG